MITTTHNAFSNAPEMSSPLIIRTEKLCKRFEDQDVLQEVSINVRHGEIYGFLGPNGAGKTTAMMTLLGLIPPTSGEIYLFGQQLRGRDPQIMCRIGVVGEEQHFYQDLTGAEYLSYFARLLGVKDAHAVETQLERVGLRQQRNQLIKVYSLGMRQRLALARALLHTPELLLLDEPANGLDPHGIRQVRELLRKLRKEGTTIFISSHILSEVEQLADRIGILHRGRLLAEGTPTTLSAPLKPNRNIVIELPHMPEGICEKLNQLPSVIEVNVEAPFLRILVSYEEDSRLQISQAVTGHGGTIIGMEVEKPSLEETFVSLTEENLENLREVVT